MIMLSYLQIAWYFPALLRQDREGGGERIDSRLERLGQAACVNQRLYRLRTNLGVYEVRLCFPSL